MFGEAAVAQDYGAPQLLDRILAFSNLLNYARKLYFFFPFCSSLVPYHRRLIAYGLVLTLVIVEVEVLG